MFCASCHHWRAPAPRPAGVNPLADSLEEIAAAAKAILATTQSTPAWERLSAMAASGLSSLPPTYGECWGMELVSDLAKVPTDGEPYILVESRHDQPVLHTVASFHCAHWMPQQARPAEPRPQLEWVDEVPLVA